MKYLLIISGVLILFVIYMQKSKIVSAAKTITEAVIDAIIAFIIKYNEGGYVNDPLDPGGETKYGISKRSYPKEDIKNLTIERATQIYKNDYVKPVIAFLSTANPNLFYQVVDMAINAGTGTAKKLYKPGMSVEDYQKARIAYYKSLKNFPLYGKSWTNRTNRIFA